MSIEITDNELQAILDDIRLNHESDELIARMLPRTELPIAPLRPTLVPDDFPEYLPRPVLLRATNDFPEPLSRPTLVRAPSEFPEPLSRPVLLRTPSEFPAPLLPLSQCVTNEFPEPLSRPTLVRATTDLLRATTDDFPAPLLPLSQCVTNSLPAPLLPLSQCVTNDIPEPNPLPDDEELPCIASLELPTLQRCTNIEYRLSPSQLERYRVADAEEKAALLSTLIPIESAFDYLPTTADEVEEIMQGFRKAL